MRQSELPRRRLAVALSSEWADHAGMRNAMAEHGIDLVDPHNAHEVLITDLRPGGLSVERTGALISAGRRAAGAQPVIYLAEAAQFTTALIGRIAEADILVPATASFRALINTVRTLVSHTDRATEAALRIQAMSALGLPLGVETVTRTEESLLLLAEPGATALHLLGELSARTKTDAVMGGSQALHALELGGANGIILLAGKNRRPQAAFTRLLRRHSDLRGIPVIIAEKKPTKRHAAYWTGNGADAVVSVDDITLGIQICRRIARTRMAAKGWDQVLVHSSLTERGETSRIAAPRYFETCLATRSEQARQPFALGALRLDPKDGDDHTAALAEVAIYLALGQRSSDLITRAAPDLFLISMPGTSKAQGASAMQAMTRMISDLKFGSKDNAVTFAARTNVIAAGIGQDYRHLIRSVIAGLPPVETPALLPA